MGSFKYLNLPVPKETLIPAFINRFVSHNPDCRYVFDCGQCAIEVPLSATNLRSASFK